jgi:hypothetical protein
MMRNADDVPAGLRHFERMPLGEQLVDTRPEDRHARAERPEHHDDRQLHTADQLKMGQCRKGLQALRRRKEGGAVGSRSRRPYPSGAPPGRPQTAGFGGFCVSDPAPQADELLKGRGRDADSPHGGWRGGRPIRHPPMHRSRARFSRSPPETTGSGGVGVLRWCCFMCDGVDRSCHTNARVVVARVVALGLHGFRQVAARTRRGVRCSAAEDAAMPARRPARSGEGAGSFACPVIRTAEAVADCRVSQPSR